MKKILAIGNSFSQDATTYLPALCELSGIEARICNLYIGGCRLSLHHENMLSERKVHIATSSTATFPYTLPVARIPARLAES